MTAPRTRIARFAGSGVNEGITNLILARARSDLGQSHNKKQTVPPSVRPSAASVRFVVHSAAEGKFVFVMDGVRTTDKGPNLPDRPIPLRNRVPPPIEFVNFPPSLPPSFPLPPSFHRGQTLQ